jgi:molybdopterin converting factor small subunit
LPSIQVEFFGVARSRAGVAKMTLDAGCLRDVLTQLQEQIPSLAELCIANDELAPGWLLNINGAAFTRDLNTSLNDGDSVLMMPADVGG